MPNHVANKMTVSGSKEELDHFIKETETVVVEYGMHPDLKTKKKPEKALLDLNTFMPMPEEIRNTVSPSRDTPVRQRELMEKYGAVDWYDWACSNWGTKWGVYDVVRRRSRGKLVYRFKTAWAPFKEDLFCEISRRFPKLKFELKFAERGMGFYGKWLAFEGELGHQEIVEHVTGISVDKNGKKVDPDSDEASDYRYPTVPKEIEELLLKSG